MVYSVGVIAKFTKESSSKGVGRVKRDNNGGFSRTGGAGNRWEPFLPLGLSGKGVELPENIMEGRTDRELPSL